MATAEIQTQERLGTVKTCFYIVEMFWLASKNNAWYLGKAVSSGHHLEAAQHNCSCCDDIYSHVAHEWCVIPEQSNKLLL